MDNSRSPSSDHPSFKQVLIFEGDQPSFPKQDPLNPNLTDDTFEPPSSKSEHQVSLAFTEDNIPIVDPCMLPGVASFEQLYLIGKTFSETLPIKPLLLNFLWNGNPVMM